MTKKTLTVLLCLLLLTGCTVTPPQATAPPPTIVATDPAQPSTQVTEYTLPPQIDQTDPPETEPTLPPQIDQTDPPETEPTEPPVTKPTIPPPTEPEPTEPPTEPEPEPDPTSGLKVHFIDVGQADCALIECNGEFALIDGGNADDGNLVVNYLTQQGVNELELVVGTHPHEDHIGGLPSVFRAFDVETAWFSAIPYHNYIVNNYIQAVKSEGIPLLQPTVGYTFDLGGAELMVIGPVHTNYEDVNDLSLVIMAHYGSTRFLFTGDMEQTAERDLLDSGADVKADVLKVGHHGSYSSTGYRFLREAAPSYGVISCGAGNEYGHPHTAPISRLQDADVTIFRTDKMYTIVATSDGKNIVFTWENDYAQPWVPAA